MTHHDRDTRDLAWLELSDAGNSAGKIARQYGTSPEAVRVVLNRIKRDLARSEG